MARAVPTRTPANFQDLAGQRFGRLSVLARAPRPGRVAWVCRCDCGAEYTALALNLRHGRTRSCGCLNREAASRRRLRHGRTGTPEYFAWGSMRGRCYNRANKKFKDYGGRGITVCDRWRRSFEAFLADMGPRPSAQHTLGRIDNDGPYSPENCAWHTQREQQVNRRDNRVLTHEGRSLTVSRWAEATGVAASTICRRLDYSGWDIARALTTPAYPGGKRPRE